MVYPSQAYLLYSPFTNRKFLHFSYALKALREVEGRFPPLALFLGAGAWLANLESKLLQRVKGRTLHITTKKQRA